MFTVSPCLLEDLAYSSAVRQRKGYPSARWGRSVLPRVGVMDTELGSDSSVLPET